MAREFRLPDLGAGLQEAEVVSWHVSVGDEVTEGEVLCEVETEKAVIEIPSPFAGVVVSLGAEEGGVIQVGEVLVVIADEAGEAQVVTAEPEDRRAASAPLRAASSTEGSTVADRPRAMPLIRKLAREAGIDLSEVTGSGSGGRITRQDVEAVIAARSATTGAQPLPAGGRREKLSGLRRSIARHMTEQWQAVPQIAGHTWIDATHLLRVRAALKERFGRMPLEALVVKAVIPALRSQPRCHAAVEGDEIVYHERFHIGIAVDTPDGLLVPVIQDADQMRLSEVVDRVEDLVSRARTRKLAPGEISGATFTISNIGALGGDFANQVIPRGTTAIISVGRITEAPVVQGDTVGVAPRLALSATFDHRALDGGTAQRFINQLRAHLEEPALFLAE